MLFNSYAFLIFLPLFAAAYWLTRGRVRLWICLLASYVFYAWWNWRFLPLVAASTLLDYAFGLAIFRTTEPRLRRRIVILSVTTNLLFLGVFKYFNFFIDSGVRLAEMLGVSLQFTHLRIILPVGISFYVFKTMSYTIDVYRGRQEPERDLLLFATFVAFFPELVAGPIVRASRMLPQLRHDQPVLASRIESGLRLVLIGYVLKVVVADSLAPLVDARFASPVAHSAISLLLGVYFYAFQIYCDFAGYSSIAIGLARIFGFDFGVNFDRPYWSRSFSEFWTRWHISLSSWLRDYLYIPLGGNRDGYVRTLRNLMIAMLLGGLWHGAQWTFVLWGALHGAYLIGQRMLGPLSGRLGDRLRIPLSLRAVTSVLLVFHLTCFAWIFFRAADLSQAIFIVRRIATENTWNFASVDQRFPVTKAIGLLVPLVVIEGASFTRLRSASLFTRPAIRLACAAVGLWLIALFGTFSGTNFIYFQF